MHTFQFGDIQLLAHCRQVNRLPAGHTAGAGRQRQRIDHAQARGRVDAVNEAIGQHLKGERLQCVARQYCGGFSKGTMTTGFASPQVIVIHGGQVIVD
jgi:hypothetical protein